MLTELAYFKPRRLLYILHVLRVILYGKENDRGRRSNENMELNENTMCQLQKYGEHSK